MFLRQLVGLSPIQIVIGQRKHGFSNFSEIKFVSPRYQSQCVGVLPYLHLLFDVDSTRGAPAFHGMIETTLPESSNLKRLI